ncbi:MAG TPA: hypothetical protein VKZ56_06485 [Membranihabitans sp.]|nr:hypothetical protein [Membranihabitans sp.]
MKNYKNFFAFILIFGLMGVYSSFAQDLNGAWQMKGNDNHLLLIQDGYFSWTETNDQNEFINTLGGILNQQGGQLHLVIQFHSSDATVVGESYTTSFTLNGKELTTRHPDGSAMVWERIPEQDQGLAGVWRITGRKTNGDIGQMERRPRKTYKILTDGHFQWVAMNTANGEFSGTGGGTYTFKDGKYTENIQFFSRDKSRVGASLSFDGKIENGDWHHSGKSSKGDPIYEIWSKETDYK